MLELQHVDILQRNGELCAAFRTEADPTRKVMNRRELMDHIRKESEQDRMCPHEAHALFALDQAEEEVKKGRPPMALKFD